jgi:cupin 2 domain-containing protein
MQAGLLKTGVAMDKIQTGNLLNDLSGSLSEESFETLVEGGNVRIERIVSRGQASPPGFWYDQDRHEWVLLIQGAARLEFEGIPGPVTLEPGSYVDIPAGLRHRVAWTAPDQTTIWLAVWYGGENA